MRRYWMIICGLLFCLSISSQEEQKEINKIKKSNHYVYAIAASTKSKEDAAQQAKDLLLLEVEQWLKDEKKEEVAGYVVKVKNNTSEIDTQRGRLYRVFAYVAKSDILPYSQDEEVETIKTVTTQNPQETTDNPPASELTEIEKQMVEIQTFTDLNSFITMEKGKGNIADCGKYSTMPKDEDLYVLVYNRLSEICAKIKIWGSESVNMVTSKKDEVANYKGCGAIWIKMKENTAK